LTMTDDQELPLLTHQRVLATPSLLREANLVQAPDPTLHLPHAIQALTESDPELLARLNAIHEAFAGLVLPMWALPESEGRQVIANRSPHYYPFVAIANGKIEAAPDFVQGADYQFGIYHGHPSSIRENAAAAVYEGEQGAELWRMLKSVAFDAGDGRIVIAHMRGDRNVSEQLLVSRLGDSVQALRPADLSVLGTEYGVVNPFLTNANPDVQIEHMFDNDLVDGPDYPHDDVVLTSTGDRRVYCWFDIRKYIMAIHKVRAATFSHAITDMAPGKARRAVRRPIYVLGGDSSLDTLAFARQIQASVRDQLKAEGLLFGDRSIPDIRPISLSDMGGTVDVSSTPKMLRLVDDELSQSLPADPHGEQPTPVLAMASNMASGIVEAALAPQTRIEFVGVNRVIRDHIRALTNSLNQAGTSADGILLFGLPGIYDAESSPFPSLLSPDPVHIVPVLKISQGVRDKLGALVMKGKSGEADTAEFYQIVQQTAFHNGISARDADESATLIVVLGATELETLMSGYHRSPKSFQLFSSDAVDGEIRPSFGKFNVVLVKPQALVAKTVASLAIDIEPQPVTTQKQAAALGGIG
jgi:prolyl-tRNA editing enzyme YbaK/EbsC (Cys-tRNA(Pro) deacylase)